VRRSRTKRRFLIAAVALAVGLGVVGVLGVRTGVTRASGGGYDLEVRYASITRPGLATVLDIQVRHPGGFDGPVTVAVDSAYLDLFDENSVDPDPSEATSDDRWVIWTFAPPPGDVLAVSFDARIEPGVQLAGGRGAVEVREGGRAVATARFTTLVLP
jgi:hypothetical protein